MGGTLGDQLLKLGLVDEKQVRKAKHEDRKSKKRKGREGVEQDRADRDAQARDRRQSAREDDRQRELGRNESKADQETQNRIQQIVVSGRVSGRTGGRRRFYFEARDGRVPLIEVNDETMTGLEGGRVAIAEDPHGSVTLVTREAAERIADLDGAWLRLWNG